MNVVIYARYSSDRQTEQSIEGQLECCYEYAKNNGYTVIGEYIDRAFSGKTASRPQFRKMITDSDKKLFQGVLVYQLDRFARNRQDSAIYKYKLSVNGVRVISASENIADDASGVLVEGVLESMAEFFSFDLARKVNRGMKINAEKCLSNGGTIPFGFKSVNKKLEIDEEKAPIVKMIFEMYADGKRVVDITDYLNSLQIRTASGSKFNSNSLHTILKNKKYIGVYTYGDIEIKDGLPRIISDDLFNKVAEILVKNKKHAGRGRAKTEYLLTTKLFCGHCRAPMVGVSARSSTGKTYYYYSCNNARLKICHKKNVSKELIENAVLEKCRYILTDENITKIAKEVVRVCQQEQDNSGIKRLNRLLKENDKAIENLLKALEMGHNIDIISERITIKRNERKFLEQEMAKEKLKHNNLTEKEIKFFLYQLKNGAINDIKYHRALINIFVNSIYLYDDRLTIIFNASDIPVTIDNILLDDIENGKGAEKSLYINRCGSPKRNSHTKCGCFLFVPKGRRFELGEFLR